MVWQGDRDRLGVDQTDDPDSVQEVVEAPRRRPVVEAFAVLAAEATTPEHPAYTYFQAHYANGVAWATKEFEELHSAGRLRPGADPAHEGRQWIALMDGLQIQWLQSLTRTDMAPLDMEAELRYRLDLLLVTPESTRSSE